ncbi:hypothetical protein MMPV_003399 [Pyropia vietnamensis]
MGLPIPFIPPLVLQAAVVNGALIAAASASRQHALTPAGVRHAAALGLLLWSAMGAAGWGLCVAFLIGGTALTRVGRAAKEAAGIAEGRGGRRGPENVWGAGAAGALCAVGMLLVGGAGGARGGGWVLQVLRLAFVSSMATKMSDTAASEVGKVYGKTAYLVTTLAVVPRGTEGAVSVEGTAAGVVASVAMGALAVAVGLIPLSGVPVVAVAAAVATTIESVIGATVQEDWGMTNEFVNFLNTSIGAGVAAAIAVVARCCTL